MRAEAIEIAWHSETSIWSVHCSPLHAKLVTAGADKTARVWQVASDLFGKLEVGHRKSNKNKATGPVSATKTSKPQTREPLIEWLADLSAHTTTVNVARFAPNAVLIATGADQGEVVLWTFEGVVRNQVDDKGKERWAQSHILRGHSADVLDISWSSDSARIASASVDNSIRIWDVSQPRVPVATLAPHDSFVQGVAFDPTGRFLSSMGSDRALVTHLADSFASVGSALMLGTGDSKTHLFASEIRSNTVFRRMAWSPDGTLLACPSGLQVAPGTQKTPLYAVHIFARAQWTSPAIQCAGLPRVPIAVSFCPVLFALRRSKPGYETSVESPRAGVDTRLYDLPYRMVFAVACPDSLLVYDTEMSTRPIARVAGLHYAEITDVSWSADGRTLFASSTDECVSATAFAPGELGEPLQETKYPSWMQEAKQQVPPAVVYDGQGPQRSEQATPGTPVVSEQLKHVQNSNGPLEKQSKNHAVEEVSSTSTGGNVTLVVPKRKRSSEHDTKEMNSCPGVEALSGSSMEDTTPVIPKQRQDTRLAKRMYGVQKRLGLDDM